MIIDKCTKTAWTILAIGLFVISEIGFKNYQSSASSKGFIYTRQKRKSDMWDSDRILAWFWTVLGVLFILGLVLQSLNILLTVIAIALLVMWIKK